jgi:LacI family transcriptional regulator
MPAVRLKDVAKKAKVSVATASLALAGKGRISEEARERVRDTAFQLGYRAGRSVRPLSAGTAVGILHAEDRAYEAAFVRPTLVEFERAIQQKGLLPVSFPLSQKALPEHVVRMLVAAGVRAVLSVQYADGAVFDDLHARGITVVVVNNSGFQNRFHSVCVDDFQGAYEGASHLLSLGHRSVAFVEYERPESPTVVADRFIGFKKALEEKRVSFSPERRITVPFMDEKKLERKLSALFGRAGRPTAIFAHDDYLGLFVIEILGRMGLRVPQEVSLVAPGDVLDYSLPLTPQICTMRIDTTLLGKLATNLLFDRMRSAEKDVHVIKVKEQLVRRASCRATEEKDHEVSPKGSQGVRAPAAGRGAH